MKDFAEIWYGTVKDVLHTFPDHSVLSEKERERRDKFVFQKDKLAFSAAHLLKRNMLSGFVNIKPKEWLFEKGSFGRPEIKKGQIKKPIFFNISHKKSVVCSLVSNIPECGVDLEDNNRKVNWKDVSKKVFTPSEIEYCGNNDQRFRNLWCLKEAYMKAKGLGFNLDPLSFSFIFEQNSIILNQHPDWQFHLENIKNVYTIACALHSSVQIEVKFTKLN